MSAEKGDEKAQIMMGDMYEYGASVPKDISVGAQWYRRAAELGNPEAQFYLGIMYQKGAGVNQDSVESLKWLFMAGEQGLEKAQVMLGGMYLAGKLSPQEYEGVIKRYQQSAEQGDAIAQYTLGWIYREGVGMPVKLSEAIQWYRKSAIQGNAKAQAALGDVYLDGIGIPTDTNEALGWYRKGAESDGRVQAMLGDLYENGRGVLRDEDEAQKWYRKAARKGELAFLSYREMQRTIILTEDKKNPERALRACIRIEIDPTSGEVRRTCKGLREEIAKKLNPQVREAQQEIQKKDFDRFRYLFIQLLIPDFDEKQLRELIFSAWQMIEEATRTREKTASELLSSLEAAVRSDPDRRKHHRKILRQINTFKMTVEMGLRDNPGSPALTVLAQRGEKVIASLQAKIKDDTKPGEVTYRKAHMLFDSGQFEAASRLFDKLTKTPGFDRIASAYVYLGVAHLARINPANIKEARKLRLKGLVFFQNALRFDGGIRLPIGYEKFNDVFEEARKGLK